ncbi:hypothetical protein B566_EDAN015642 [Ephemera danica]|nr:hypothetical protein B566_EDAN015642 [Ephemera danica]
MDLLVQLFYVLNTLLHYLEKVVCYYGSWATYRPDAGKFDVEDIDPNLCTHLIYTFIGTDENGTVVVLDPDLDIIGGGFQRFNNLRLINPSLKTLIAIGGWNANSTIFSMVVGDNTTRSNFVNNLYNFVKLHDFNGLDFLRALFASDGLLLTAAVGVIMDYTATSYDVPALSVNLDFINLMTFDFHGLWDGVTGIHSSLHPYSADPISPTSNVEATVQHWMQQGAPAEKLIIGIPFFGRSYTLQNSKNTNIGAPITGGGDANFAISRTLGGAMVWSVDMDDFRGTCALGLEVLSQLKSKMKNQTIILLIAILTITSITNAQKKVVCYYGSWATYRPDAGKFDVEDIDPNLCTHLIYTFIDTDENGTVVVLDPDLDIIGGGFQRFNNLRLINPSLKTLIAIGGWNANSTIYSMVVEDNTTRSNFVNNLYNFVKLHEFNGLDLDWEYPAQRGGAPEDKENFVLLIRELRALFEPDGLLLTAAVGANVEYTVTSYDVPELAANLDFINLMTYDFHGFWDNEATVQHWRQQGAPGQKLIIGVSLYGRSYTLENPNNFRVGAPTTGGGDPGPYTLSEGSLGYNEANFAITRILGGAMVWSVDTDDFRGNCGLGRYPLLKVIHDTLIP